MIEMIEMMETTDVQTDALQHRRFAFSRRTRLCISAKSASLYSCMTYGSPLSGIASILHVAVAPNCRLKLSVSFAF